MNVNTVLGLGEIKTAMLLDEEGKTTRDPQPVDDNMNPITNYRKTDEFPYRRD